MAKAKKPIDKVRASRDGHEYHEAWAARHAMRLLLPNASLAGIAVEGLEPGDQETTSLPTVEIADLTFYYGQRVGLKRADKVCITQFKYSIRDKSKSLRASAAKETVEKFGKAYRSLKRKHGAKLVRDKVTFELHTNRPIYNPLVQAISALAEGRSVTGDVKTQAHEFATASGLTGATLSEFAAKCHFQSLNDTLRETKAELTRAVVDWSGSGADALARARLGDLKQLVRDKAGFAGTDRNVIQHTDILGALGLSDTSDLLPCPEALADVGEIVEREQLPDVIGLVPHLDKPLLVHAAGGVGKTVFMDSLCRALAADHETVFFDCFGGGDYRAPGDARHHPRRGLIHIANTLACRGRCDPIIPGASDIDSLMNTFRRRLEQCVNTITKAAPQRKLILFVDAIDNAAGHARDRQEDAFPVLLAEHLHSKPVPGVKLVVSSRSHRIPIQHIPYKDCELRPFSRTETESYLRARLPDVTQAELRVAQARSGGNPRVLEYMLDTGRKLLDESEIEKELELDDLIQTRIDRALSEAMKRGFKTEDTDAFLAGLAVLPPPVPMDEYAQAHGMDKSAIESFASDLWPLLERTKYGLTFRDEPTEDLVRDRYASIEKPLRRLAKNLMEMQCRSVYAARSLPDLLLRLGDAKQLFKLAFDERFPAAITSTVGKRNIRSSRLKAAARHAAHERDYDQLVQLTVELSTIAAVDRRGADYIMECPDLVIATRDTDATRRLFETRTEWQGTRHARLTIANTLSGDPDEAVRHALATEDWLRHFWQQERRFRPANEGPQTLDDAAIPFYLLSQRRFDVAAGILNHWYDWYSYQVGEYVFELAKHPDAGISDADMSSFLDVLSDEIGCMTAAVCFLNLKKPECEKLLGKLAKAARKVDKLHTPDNYSPPQVTEIQDGLRKAATIAMSYGDTRAAVKIAGLALHDRPAMWSFHDHFSDRYVLPFVFHAALTAAVKGVDVREKDLMPKDIAPIAAGIANKLAGDDFRKEIIKRLEKRVRSRREEIEGTKKEGTISYEDKGHAERYLSSQLEPLLLLTNALAKLLAAPRGRADLPFTDLVKAWEQTRAKKEDYRPGKYNVFFQLLGSQLAQFALWARVDLKAASIRTFLERLHEQEVLGASTLIDVVAILAKRRHLHTLAGQQAVKCLALIETENEVTHRASLYAKLARAILPASADEAAEYFRKGLEQMDVIGSGDYQYTNHLLLLAASLKGPELKDADFHTLTNIAELNLSDEPEKFPWFAFGQGLSRASGCKALAKLGRWDDRGKVALDCTLRPYLAALINDGNIEPEDALALNWLADPAEFWGCNTETFAEALDSKSCSNKKELVTELIQQYEANNPGLTSASAVRVLADIAKRTLGPQSKITSFLSSAHPRFGEVWDTRNWHLNYRPNDDARWRSESVKRERQSKRKLDRVAASTLPADEQSLSKAFETLIGLDNAYLVRDDFLDKLRAKVAFGDRAEYLRNLARFEHVNLYWKLDEFKKCKAAWSDSSTALQTAYRDIAVPLVLLHADDLASNDQLSTDKLYELSELTGFPVAALALELVKLFAEPESSVSPNVWLGLACLMCEEAAEGKGQVALTRLLRSDAAKLSESVFDGPWKRELYPKRDTIQIFAGLVWRQLGSPHAVDRWRAAHCIRSFARFGRWHIIDALVARLEEKDARPFQAPELIFYFMHAKLWLLIALARLARDHPAAVAKYKTNIMRVIDNVNKPHVVIRHFAARTLIACIDAAEISVTAEKEAALRAINDSPFARLHKKLRPLCEYSYRGRPETAPKPKAKFTLEYDFNKEDVQYLSKVFGQDQWRVADLIAEAVKSIDPRAESMYELGGREGPRQFRRGVSSAYHVYGEYLGWHGMLIAAGHLLKTKPVTDDWWHDEPWEDWLGRYLLTRKDGLWLSDGRDRAPLGVSTILMETAKDGLELTGDRKKILDLVGLKDGIVDEVIVAGRWFSADHVRVHINSVLVRPRKSRAVIRELLAEEPITVWLPFYEESDDGGDYLSSEKENCTPWIVFPSPEPRLDGEDPLASKGVIQKPRIAQEFANSLGLRARDPFGQKWTAKGGKLAHSEAWGYSTDREGSSGDGQRLVCNKTVLSEVLANNDMDLLLLVDLQKYEKGFQYESGKYWNTIAVIRIKQSLDIEYHKGKVNHLWKPSW